MSSDSVTICKIAKHKRKLSSNSQELEKLWIENGLNDEGKQGVQQLKILELNWNPENDELSLEVRG